ncbi:beta-ketoacyl synthase N-terminal-like domain-containing protein [Candidatus Margulisiibacteriota bacterium]
MTAIRRPRLPSDTLTAVAERSRGKSGAEATPSPDLGTFWQNLIEAKDLIKEIPKDRFDYQPWFGRGEEEQDKIYCKWGSFIDDVDKFDPEFFNISPREARTMDPQLRILLEVLYHTAENAGYEKKIKNTKTGMYVGACFHDYQQAMDLINNKINPYYGTGNAATMLANRPSYFFNLSGPSLTVDTACSSSLVALHLACQALKQNECEMAFVSGVNLILSSIHYRYFCSIGALSYTGRCHTFDKNADGYVPGEGIASVLLKPLNKAKADGDRILAVIKGTAVNHGGYTPSVTAPSVKLEAEVIKDAWKNAGIDPQNMGYIEAHGTGTKLGDPVEIKALQNAFDHFNKDETKEKFCAIGSAKAHVGHTEGAAGITGLIKLILSMQNKKIPAMPKFNEANPFINFKDTSIYVNEKAIDWQQRNNKPRLGGVSSFGFGGAYSHVVVEESPVASTPLGHLGSRHRFKKESYWFESKPQASAKAATFTVQEKQSTKEILRAQLKEILQLQKEIINNQPFANFGLDSITGLEWLKVIRNHFKIDVPNTILFDYSTINDLSEYIEKKLGLGQVKTEPKKDYTEQIDTILDKVDTAELSLEDVAKLMGD